MMFLNQKATNAIESDCECKQKVAECIEIYLRVYYYLSNQQDCWTTSCKNFLKMRNECSIEHLNNSIENGTITCNLSQV